MDTETKEKHNQLIQHWKESDYYKKQWNLIHQMKREMDNWENYENQKKTNPSLFNGEYEIYTYMLNISQEFVSNWNNHINSKN